MYEFSQAWLLLLWFLPVLVYKFCSPVQVEYQFALRVPFFEKWSTKTQYQKSYQNIPWFWHCCGIWFLLVLALAGPRWVGRPEPMTYDTHHLMLVLDISGSMGLEDMPTNRGYQSRWNVVRKTAMNFVNQRNQDKYH